MAPDRPGSAARHEKAAEHPDGGRFSRSVRPEEAEYLPLLDLQADIVHGDEITERAAQVLYLDGYLDIIHPVPPVLPRRPARLFVRAMKMSSREGRMALLLVTVIPSAVRRSTTLSDHPLLAKGDMQPVTVNGDALDPDLCAHYLPRCPGVRRQYLFHGQAQTRPRAERLVNEEQSPFIHEPDSRASLRLVEISR